MSIQKRILLTPMCTPVSTELLFGRGIALTAMMDELVEFQAPAIVEAPEDLDIEVVRERRREVVLN